MKLMKTIFYFEDWFHAEAVEFAEGLSKYSLRPLCTLREIFQTESLTTFGTKNGYHTTHIIHRHPCHARHHDVPGAYHH
jgi:hypothetical protein